MNLGTLKWDDARKTYAAGTGLPALDRQLDRWYPLRDHPVQLALLAAVPNGIRFPLVPAGRRSGKTERFKRFLVKQAYAQPGKYFAAAPTHAQAKKIFWDDLKALCLASALKRKPSESELIIQLPSESEIHVIGLDKPERIEGIPWSGGGIDEIADIKGEAWGANILPALGTEDPRRPGHRAWCWLLGVPDGLNHYYDMCERVRTGEWPEAAIFHWLSADILSPEKLAEFKNAMSARQFRQEFEASFETAQGRIYSDYGADNWTTEEIQPHEQLCWMHDFNFTPLSSAIGVRRGAQMGDLYLLDEIVLQSAVARQSALEFVERYKGHANRHLLLYGDPAGKAGEKHAHESDYTEIEKVLRDHGWNVRRKVKAAAPAIVDRQNAVRARIKSADGAVRLFVHPTRAKYCHKGLGTVQFKKGSAFQEDDKNEYQHITTAIGYMVDVEWPSKRKGLALENVTDETD